MRGALLLTALCACGRIGFSSSADGGLEGRDADATSAIDSLMLGPFGVAQPIPSLQAAFDIDDPAISPDGLELYVSSRVGANEDIYVSRRASRSDPWPVPVIVPGMDTTENETGPELTGDGLSLYFMQGNAVMEASRPDTLSPWTIVPTGINQPATDTPAVCGDGRVLYLRVGDATAADIYVSTRVSTSASWTPPVVVPELSSATTDSAPWLTPSCDRIYFDSDRTMVASPFMAQRTGASATFGTPVEIPDLRAQVGRIRDLSLTVDERIMVFSHGASSGFDEIWETSR